MAEQQPVRSPDHARRQLLVKLLDKEGIELPAGRVMPGQKAANFAPLSFSQERLWFLDQLNPGNAAYNIARALRLKGNLDRKVLALGIDSIIRRHEILRSMFPSGDDGPIQSIVAEVAVPLPLVNLSALPRAQRRSEMNRVLAEKSRVKFVLDRGPLIQAHLIELGKAEHVLLLVLHQMVCDGWSINLFLRELAAIYRCSIYGKAARLPELKIQYTDYADGQRQRPRTAALKEQLDYWRTRLKDRSSGIAFATDHPRPAVQSFRGARLRFAVPKALFRRIENLGRETGATPFMVLMAAFNVMLWRYTAQDDISIGFPIANRNRRDVGDLIGLFVNTLVLRTDLSGNPTLRDLLKRVRVCCREALAHQDLPFDKLVEELQPERDLSRNPLFQVMFSYQNYPAAEFNVPWLRVEPVELTVTTSKFDLTLSLTEHESSAQGFIEYATDLFARPTIVRMARHFMTLLRGIIADPDQWIAALPLLPKRERRRILVQWNDTAANYPKDRCIHHLFEAQARRVPRAVALECGGKQLTYEKLNCRANQLARFLQKSGIGPEKFAAICLNRSLEMVIGLLGILKSGAAYLPLDPKYPRERIAFMVDDARVSVLITQKSLVEDGRWRMEDSDSRLSILDPQIRIVCLDGDAAVIARQSAKNPTIHIGSKNLAYVIYTSGSTGRPKGVAIEHGNAVAFLQWAKSVFSRAELAGVVASTSICFDLSIFELFAPLSHGGKVILVEDALDLADMVERKDITLINTVPSAMNELLETGGLPHSVRTANLAGEVLKPELVRQLYAVGNLGKVYDLYGPSETTTYSTFALRLADARATVGRPVANTQIYLLDAVLQPVPVGVPGELCIGGAGVARGYLRRPDLTAEKFLSDPFAKRSGARMYRSGDLARYDPDGNIEYLGRIDDQVKIRGYRIEPGEIEAALAAHPAIVGSVVVPRSLPLAASEPLAQPKSKTENARSDARLLAYFVPRDGMLPPAFELRNFLREKLPEFMLPVIFIPLKTLPLTPNGKVDRLALPAAETEAVRVAQGLVAPRTETEEIIAQVWRDVLHIERIGVFDDFFDLGGHSLLATRVVARLRRSFDVELPLRNLFEARSVARLAREVEVLRLERRGLVLPGLVPARRTGPVPLSFAQRRLWFLHKLEPGLSAYHMPAAYRIHGPLNIAVLEQAFNQIIRRHEVLQSAVVEIGGEPMQQIMPDASLNVSVVDLTSLSAQQVEREVERRANEDAEQLYDLAAAPLMRAKILRLGVDDHVLLLNFHHIICDGSSLAIFYREVAALYEAFSRGREYVFPSLPAQYGDFAVWQQQLFQEGRLEQQAAYWRRQLGGSLAPIDLPADWERPVAQTYRGARVSRRLSRALTTALKKLARKEHVTLFMILLAALKMLLSRLAGQNDIVVGSTVAGRNRPELEGLIGFFINGLALRTDLSGNPEFTELLRRVREVCLDSYTHQDLPFERVVEELNPQRDFSRNPIFQVLFNMVDISERDVKLSGCTMVKVPRIAAGAKFDLVLHAPEIDGSIELDLVYNADLFAEARAQAMLEQWSYLLAQIGADSQRRIERFSLVEPSAKALLPDPTEPLDDSWQGPIDSWLARRAQERPEKEAVIDDRETWSYEELDRLSNRLARHFLHCGIESKDVVAIYAHRDASLALALLGILKAGAVFVVLDPAYPPARLVDYLRVARPIGLLEMESAGELATEVEAYVRAADIRTRVKLPRAKGKITWFLARRPATAPNLAVTAGDPAYIAFTSGSTGEPKGVLCRHGPMTHFLPWQKETFDLRDSDRYGLLSGLGYNHLHRDLFTALALGASLRVPSARDLKEPKRLARWLGCHEISILHLTPALGRFLQTGAGKVLPSLRRIFFGGDLLLRQDVLAMHELAPNAELVSFYGATETQRAVGYFVIPGALLKFHDRARRIIPTGQGAPGVQLLLLTRSGQLAGIGEVGELHIRSPHLADGYVGDPELSKTSFVANPFTDDPRDRLYRTRELGRYLPDGNVEWLGRNDRRASIRGFRVELAEVETAIRQCSEVRHAAVVAENIGDEPSGPEARLIAYVEGMEGKSFPAALREFLTAKLPRHMIPADFHFIERLPLDPNGKIDYAALRLGKPLPSPAGRVFEPSKSRLERGVAKIFAEVLRLERIGRRDNFFELGGHSLLAAKAAARLRETLGVGFDLRAFLESPSVEAICRRIEIISGQPHGARWQSDEREEIEL